MEPSHNPDIEAPGGHGGLTKGTRTEVLPSGLTARQERLLARRALKARLAESKAGAMAGAGLTKCVEILNEHLEADEVSPTEARRTADTFMALTKRAQEADPNVVTPEATPENHLHIHAALTPDAMESALEHMRDARKGPRLHDGNGKSG